MNNKIRNVICLFLLTLISFFGFSDNLMAAKIGFYASSAAKKFPKLTFSLKYQGKEVYSKNIQEFSFLYKDTVSEQVYCIEPEAKINGNGSHSESTLGNYNGKYFNKNNTAKTDLLKYVLTFAYKAPTVNKDISAADTAKIIAAQGLIWQIAVGEVKFNTNRTGISISGDFYNQIKNSSNANVQNIYKEYNRIITAVKESFLSNPPGFSTAAVANPIELVYNSQTGDFRKTINSTKFQYYDIVKTNGLKVTKTNNSITLSSTSAISKDNAKIVEISVHSANKGEAKAYYKNDQQDVVSIYGTTSSRYIKVYTPKFQLKITKEALLDGKKLKGVKFNVYEDNKCTKLLDTITTGSDGTAKYENIPKPGTYCLKEVKTSTPDGYEENSNPISITVSSSNIAGSTSYATKTIKNKNKEFNLTKKTVDEKGNVVDLDDGCGTDIYTGPEFEIKENGNSLYFKEIRPGEYDLTTKDDKGATTKLRTCKGKFKVYTLTKCNYTISETKAPEGLTLPSEPTKAINVCGSDKNVSFTNGFAGLEFQKKDDDGKPLSGGKFSLQRKINNVYQDVLLKQTGDGSYVYDSNLNEKDEGTTYIILTNNGRALISKLAPGEYRVVEKEAPKGYELIQDKDSTALVTIKDSDQDGYYLVEMINKNINKNGSDSSAELIVTITTGRKVPNYIFIISALVVLLIIAIILRKRIKK